jgi:GT2 family glycosyltransferase/glycosyltransferase involved in cell wall biosynthesis
VRNPVSTVFDVSIIIPVLDKLEFTRQCLDRIWRNTGSEIAYEVIIVDNASSDGTPDWFANVTTFPRPLRYVRNVHNQGFAKANNTGGRLSESQYLLFLNNDTLVQPGWLTEMLRARRSDRSIGVVGIKQLFPYTNTIYHTGIVFAPGGIPTHLYPHLDASLPHVNKEREYQAVNGACLLIDRSLFEECGGFDEAYVNGYEDVDLCMAVGQRGRKVVCCTRSYIYHYGQISEGRTADDDRNAALFAKKWSGRIRVDRDAYLVRDRTDAERAPRTSASVIHRLAEDCFYLADDLGQGSALTWMNADLALALHEQGVPVFISGAQRSSTLPASTRRRLATLALPKKPVGGVQIKWSHYWPRHLNLELAGDVNLELFVVNYLFGSPGSEPWDYWLQCLRQNHHEKLPLSEFCRSVLSQVGVPVHQCHVLHPGYSREVRDVEPPRRADSSFRFLTVTNSNDLGRYNALSIIEAYRRMFGPDDDVVLVIKDYGAGSTDTTIRDTIAPRSGGPRIDYIGEFTDKRELISLYKSCDAFVSAHRGEGFGMKILDAMACGLPVITPLFGGPTDYCTTETCFPVELSLVPMGDCLDSRSLSIANRPLWAQPDTRSLGAQMRKVHDEREAAAALGARARETVLDRFSWNQAASRLVEISSDLRARRPRPSHSRVEPGPSGAGQSPYWLGLRVSVIVPTHNRKEKLLACLDALARQSVLPQEFEVVVVDDGSTDGTGDALAGRSFPFALRVYRQDGGGPGTARNLGIEQAAGELVFFIGDDILADERLLEEHLLAHAVNLDPGTAILGRIDWPDSVTPNAVMEYVCGDGMLQFAYTLIPKLATLDYTFFYTSNISLKRRFLLDAADAGVRFDPCFRHAAFEDSEYAFRLTPRGLRIRYAERARAFHDHWMDLDSFAARELHAGEMAVVYYRKHPGQDQPLQVRWVAELTGPAAALLKQPELLHHLEAFDGQTNTLLRAQAASLEELLSLGPQLGPDASPALSAERLRAALHSVLRVIFDVERTRGKVQEWFSEVDDPTTVRAAQTLGSILRKIEFLNLNAGPLGLPGTTGSIDTQVIASLRQKVAELEGAASNPEGLSSARRRLRRAVRRILVSPSVLGRLLAADRFVQARLQTAWLERYQRVRSRIRSVLS